MLIKRCCKKLYEGFKKDLPIGRKIRLMIKHGINEEIDVKVTSSLKILSDSFGRPVIVVMVGKKRLDYPVYLLNGEGEVEEYTIIE